MSILRLSALLSIRPTHGSLLRPRAPEATGTKSSNFILSNLVNTELIRPLNNQVVIARLPLEEEERMFGCQTPPMAACVNRNLMMYW